MGGAVQKAKEIVQPVVSAFNLFSGKGFNPFVALGIFAVGWLFTRSQKPDIPDYGTNDFEDYGMDADGIVSNLSCSNENCGVFVEVYLPMGGEDESSK